MDATRLTRITQSGLGQCVLLALLALAALAYWPGLAGGFIFDDFPNLVHSESWRIRDFSAESLSRALGSDISGALGRPLAMLSFAFNHALAGPAPFGLKLTNLLLHLVNGLLVFLLSRQLLPLLLRGKRAADWAHPTAAVIAGAWLLHPLQVSTVHYTIQRMELGAATGVLGCLSAYLLARREQLAGRPAGKSLGLAGLMLLFGLGFKESALLALPLLLLIEWLGFGFRGADGSASRILLVLHFAWLVAAALIYLFVTLPGALQPGAYVHRDFDLGQRLLSQGPVLVMYLKQICLPLPDSMLFYYDHLVAPTGLLSPPWTAAAWGLLMVFAGGGLAMRRRYPLVALGIFWFFVCQILTSNVIPLELAFEHRNYLALLGPLFVLAQGLVTLTGRLNGDAALATGMALVLALAALCHIQSKTWADPFRLATALASRNPESPRANYELGTLLYKASGQNPSSPQWSLARRQFEVAATLRGASALPDQALVVMTYDGANLDEPDRWTAFAQKLLSQPLGADNLSALHSVVGCRLTHRCDIESAAVLGLLQRLQEKNPDNAVLAIIRANFLWNAGADRGAAIEVLRRWRKQHAPSYQVSLALLEFLLASNLHPDSQEVAGLLAELEAIDLPPHAGAKLDVLRKRWEASRQAYRVIE